MDRIMVNKTHRVLLIDDDPMIRSWLREVFDTTEFELLEAANGKEGIKQLAKGSVDLVITDIIMPEKEGIELIIEVRQEHGDIPIIAVSGGSHRGVDDYLQMAKKLGANMTLTKPFSADEILFSVKSFLGA